VTGACCLPTGGGLAGGCQVTTQANCTLAGGTYQGDGTNCGTATNPTCTPPATGACCLPTSAGGIGGCQVMSQAQCTQLGGTYQGNGTNCGAIGSSGPCGPPPVLGACCLPASPLAIATCQLVTQAQCAQLGGTYQGNGTHCGTPGVPGPCPQPQVGRCCLPNHVCTVTTQAQCTQLGGTYGGNGTICNTFSNCP
jgi:hypothetical protein